MRAVRKWSAAASQQHNAALLRQSVIVRWSRCSVSWAASRCIRISCEAAGWKTSKGPKTTWTPRPRLNPSSVLQGCDNVATTKGLLHVRGRQLVADAMCSRSIIMNKRRIWNEQYIQIFLHFHLTFIKPVLSCLIFVKYTYLYSCWALDENINICFILCCQWGHDRFSQG